MALPPASLANAELAFNEQDNTLYYGTGTGGAGGTATSVIAIAGSGAFVATTGAQTIAGAKTFSSIISGSIDGNAGTATNTDALAGAGIFVFIYPAEEAIEKVLGIEIAVMKQAVCETERHGGVVSPCPGRQLEIPTGQHFPNLREAAAILELHWCSQRIAGREASWVNFGKDGGDRSLRRSGSTDPGRGRLAEHDAANAGKGQYNGQDIRLIEALRQDTERAGYAP